MNATDATNARFSRYAWGLVAYNLFVIVWGAVVRATGSGAGCGNHWPSCNGEVVPLAPSVETMIELFHRITSAADGFLVILLVVWAWRLFPKGHRVRWAAAASLFFILLEGWLGRQLVVRDLVVDNDTMERAWVVGFHLLNTYLLVGALTVTAWFSQGHPAPRLAGQRATAALLGLALVGVALLGMTGAITALGDTLFPIGSVVEGIQQDLSPTAHILIRLRVIHPLLALGTGLYLILLANGLRRRTQHPLVARIALLFMILYAIQFVGGMINIALLAPIWMQVIHLLLADVTWIALIVLTLTVLGHAPATAQAREWSVENEVVALH